MSSLSPDPVWWAKQIAADLGIANDTRKMKWLVYRIRLAMTAAVVDDLRDVARFDERDGFKDRAREMRGRADNWELVRWIPHDPKSNLPVWGHQSAKR